MKFVINLWVLYQCNESLRKEFIEENVVKDYLEFNWFEDGDI